MEFDKLPATSGTHPDVRMSKAEFEVALLAYGQGNWKLDTYYGDMAMVNDMGTWYMRNRQVWYRVVVV